MTDDTTWAHDELLWLTQALRGHAEWGASCGAPGLPSVTAEWLETRREQYRQYQPEAPDAETPDAEAASEIVEVPPSADVSAPEPQSPTPFPVQPPPEAKPPDAQTTAPDVAASPPFAPPAEPRSPEQPNPVRQVPVSQESVPRASAPRASAPRASAPLSSAAAPEQSSAPGPRVALPLIQLSGDTQQQLAQLEAQVRGCTACSLHESRTNTVFARGTGSSGVCFIGEGPGADEDAQGLPFVGKAGQLLDKMITAMGLPREDVYVCNIVKCRPPNNRKPTAAEMSGCVGYLERQLELIRPRVIVALGGTAVEGLLGLSVGITRIRGNWRLYKGKIPVMPTFHPAYLLRQPNAKRQVWQDLQGVLGHLNLEVPKRRS